MSDDLNKKLKELEEREGRLKQAEEGLTARYGKLKEMNV